MECTSHPFYTRPKFPRRPPRFFSRKEHNAAEPQPKAGLTTDCPARQSRSQVGVTTDFTDFTDKDIFLSVKSVKSVVRILRKNRRFLSLTPNLGEHLR
jgi:hypothetical protein